MSTSISLLVWALTLFSMAQGVHAETPLSPKAQYAADSRAAAQRYASDKKLCLDEASSAARLQCRRDARTAYDKAITSARARMSVAGLPAPATPATSVTPPAKAEAPVHVAPACPGCGRVVSVTTQEKSGEGTPLGLIAGGAAGAILGHQVGSGTGKDLATIAGAVGGAYAGKKIEEKAKSHTVWIVVVRFEDGSNASYEFPQDPGFKAGDRVKKAGDSVIR